MKEGKTKKKTETAGIDPQRQDSEADGLLRDARHRAEMVKLEAEIAESEWKVEDWKMKTQQLQIAREQQLKEWQNIKNIEAQQANSDPDKEEKQEF